MTTHKLPRLDNNTTNRQTALGWIQTILGASALLGTLVFFLLKKLFRSYATLSGALAFLVWVLLVVGCWFLSVGLNRLTVNATFRQLQPRLKGGAFTLEKHAQLLGVSEKHLLSDLSKMSRRGYWDSMTVLDDAVVFTPKGANPKGDKHYKILASDGKRFFTGTEGQSFPQAALAALVIGLLFLLQLPLNNFIWFFVGLAVSFPLNKVIPLIMPKQKSLKYAPIPQYSPDKIELVFSGNEQADILIGQGESYLNQLQDLEQTINDAHIKGRIQEISTGTRQMVDQLQKTPDKHRLVNQTFHYSLPTAINLFYKYIELDRQPVKGENITRSLGNIAEMSDLVAETFRKELNALYQDQMLNIEVDIEVMENMLRQEEMDFSPLAVFKRDQPQAPRPQPVELQEPQESLPLTVELEPAHEPDEIVLTMPHEPHE